MTIGAYSFTADDYSVRLGGDGAGDVFTTAPSYSTGITGSDRRLKRNITTISGALNQILGINGVEFN